MVLRQGSVIPTLRHEGSLLELGRRIGAAMKPQLQAVAADLVDEFASTSVSLSDLAARQRPLVESVEAFVPSLLDDLRGRAEASGVPFPLLFHLNAGGYRPQPGKSKTLDHCTSVISRSQSGSVLGHNEDATPTSIDDIFFLDATVPACIGPARTVRLIGLCYAYTLVGCAATLNHDGLFVCVDSLNDPSTETGIPCDFITRMIVEQSSIEDALAVPCNILRSGAASLTLAQKLRAFNCEISSKAVEVYELPGDSAWVHTNHFVLSSPACGSQESLARRSRGNSLARPNMRVAEMQELLADRGEGQGAICRERTLASVVGDTTRLGLYVCFGEPHSGGWRWHEFA